MSGGREETCVCKLIEVEIELWWCGGERGQRINHAYISVDRSWQAGKACRSSTVAGSAVAMLLL